MEICAGVKTSAHKDIKITAFYFFLHKKSTRAACELHLILLVIWLKMTRD